MAKSNYTQYRIDKKGCQIYITDDPEAFKAEWEKYKTRGAKYTAERREWITGHCQGPYWSPWRTY